MTVKSVVVSFKVSLWMEDCPQEPGVFCALAVTLLMALASAKDAVKSIVSNLMAVG